MANNPITETLPADLPENWQPDDIISPDGVSAGMTPQHAYNYLMSMVNAAQRALAEVAAFYQELADTAYVDSSVEAIAAGGLKVPISLALESLLPTLPGSPPVPNGTYYVIANMDVSWPGQQGRAWLNTDVSTTSWQKIEDKISTPDSTWIDLDTNSQLTISAAKQALIDGALQASSGGTAGGAPILDSDDMVPMTNLHAGEAGGVATLDANVRLPYAQLPWRMTNFTQNFTLAASVTSWTLNMTAGYVGVGTTQLVQFTTSATQAQREAAAKSMIDDNGQAEDIVYLSSKNGTALSAAVPVTVVCLGRVTGVV